MSLADGVTRDARTACNDWLLACLRLGWSKDRLDDLEALWWRYHDRQGARVDATASGGKGTTP